MLHIAALVIAALYAGYAVVVYWRLRTSSEHKAETLQTQFRVRCTPSFPYVAVALVASMPLIAELTCAINGLLWPAEMITRPWRSPHAHLESAD